MQIIMIPGFWLTGDSWSQVIGPLRDAGHTVHTPTLPGMEAADADRSGIGLRDHVDAVVAIVDDLASDSGTVALVGHSGGGAIAHAVSDARPESIAHVIYVDSWPMGHGEVINANLPVVDGEIPLPDWDVFEEEDLIDLTDELREAFRARAIPQPLGVAIDPQVLSDTRRYDIPSTIVCCECTGEQLKGWMDAGEPALAETGRLLDVTYVDLPTGHWPQFTRPAELAREIVRALD